MPGARRHQRLLRSGIRVFLILSVISTILVGGLAFASQFRTYSVVRMVITTGPNGSVNTRWLPRTDPRGVIADRHRSELIYERSIGEPATPQPPSTKVVSHPVMRGGWLSGSVAPIRWKFLDVGVGRELATVPVSGTPNLRAHIMTRTTVFLPWWLLIFSSACPALLWLAHRLRTRPARRQARGLCRRCAYDLRGIDSPLCPECAATRPSPKTPL